MSKSLPLLTEDTGGCVPLMVEPLSAIEAADLSPLFKALGDPVRLRLMSMIASHDGGEACVCDLTGTFDLSAPTISHHLKVLRESGLVSSERRGTWVYNRANADVVSRMAALLGEAVPALV